MTAEGDRKVEQDLADTRRIIAELNQLRRRIDAATQRYLGEGDGDGRPKPA